MNSSFIPSSNPPAMPQELLDAIIDYLHDDHTTLKACSTLSRGSLRTAQSHLFSSVKLTPPSRSHHQTLCERLRQLVCGSPHLATYIKHLTIVEGYHINREQLDISRRPTCQYAWVKVEMALSFVLKMLTNMQRLTIQGPVTFLVWDHLPTSLRQALLVAVNSPQLTCIELTSVLGFLPLLEGAVKLTSVGLYSTPNFIGHNEIDAPKQRLHELESLNILVNVDILRWFLHPKARMEVSNLRSLTLHITSEHSESDGFADFFNKLFECSSTLEHLHIRLPSTISFVPLTNLGKFHSLRSLYVDLCPEALYVHGFGYSAWFIQLLSTIPDSNSIETIAIHFSFSYPDYVFSPAGYRQLDGILMRPSLSLLRSVRVKVGVDLGGDPREKLSKAVSWCRERLPLTSSRGILHVEPNVDWITQYNPGCNMHCS